MNLTPTPLLQLARFLEAFSPVLYKVLLRGRQRLRLAPGEDAFVSFAWDS